MDDDPRRSFKPNQQFNRRRLIQGAGASAGLALAAAFPTGRLSAADRKLAWNLWQQENPGATPTAVEAYAPIVLSMAEWATLTAVVDRIFPKTDTTPGGAETGAHIYIDQMLSTAYAKQSPTYRTGLAAIESAVDGGFAAGSADAQDAALSNAEAGKLDGLPDGFFSLLLEHTRQGMFCDPIHGGNREFMGWDMIGYPGVKLVWTANDQAVGTNVAPEHISVAKYQGTAQ